MAPTKTLFDALGLEDLLPEEQETILLDLNSLIMKGSLVRLAEMMDEKTRADFDALMSGDPSEDDVQAFLEERVPNADIAVADTVRELTDDILAVTGTSQD